LKETIYLISGLGADERIFQNIDFGSFTPKHIKWIEPIKNEMLKSYALRLSVQIETENPIILGVSFGGMLAVEIAKYIDCQQVILISSAHTKHEIPLIYRVLGQLKIHKLIPIKLFKQANVLTYWFFGMQTQNEKALLKSILHDTDSTFLKWAIHSIVNWTNVETIDKIVHFHGETDRILPIQNIKRTDFRIAYGGHLMIFKQADTISRELKNILKA
jgi:pimeloyl-ACP methyl ester carboxylesterase